MEYRDVWMDYRAVLMECIVDGDVMCCVVKGAVSTLSKEPYIPSKEPYIPSKEPYIPSKEPYIPSKDIFCPVYVAKSHMQKSLVFHQKSPIFHQECHFYFEFSLTNSDKNTVFVAKSHMKRF